jgi:hypothetical protein
VKAKPKRRTEAEMVKRRLDQQLTVHLKPFKGGKPRRKFDLALIEEYGRLGFSLRDLAAYLRTSEEVIHQRMKEIPPDDPDLRDELPDDYGAFRTAYETGRAKVSRALRTKQIQMALEGNERMLVHLGQHWLGQMPTQLLDVNATVASEVVFTIKASDHLDDLPSANVITPPPPSVEIEAAPPAAPPP